MNKEGPSTIRWKSWRREQRLKALDRARGRCEFHRHVLCVPPHNWHHLFGRNDEPWSSFHPFTMIICSKIHMSAHSNLAIRDALRWMGIREFRKLNTELSIDENMFETLDPRDIFNYIVRESPALPDQKKEAK